jgi:hypothetical protein
MKAIERRVRNSSQLNPQGGLETMTKAKRVAAYVRVSTTTKCEKDSRADCDATAKAKNLHGAAETSFTTECVKDAVGK